uniref:Uncharacterized protein n=1 Tax=Arundo donax TaxID=35708 RepID=A0A0A9GZ88_ARUDO
MIDFTFSQLPWSNFNESSIEQRRYLLKTSLSSNTAVTADENLV